jgi:hypothetical protein
MQTDVVGDRMDQLGWKILAEISAHKTPVRGSNEAIPAIVVSEPPSISEQAYYFDKALKSIVWDMNRRVGAFVFTVCMESTNVWTIMGGPGCEYMTIRLDPSYTFFRVELHTPFSMNIMWRFCHQDIKKDIENAFAALFV